MLGMSVSGVGMLCSRYVVRLTSRRGYFIPQSRSMMYALSHNQLQSRNLLRQQSLDTEAGIAWQLQQVRYHWRNRKKIRAPPTKPLSFDSGGDVTKSFGIVDLKQPRVEFDDIPDLESSDEMVQKLVSLEYSPHADLIEKVLSDLLDKVKDHPLDVQSLEVTIVRHTVQIRNQIKHCLDFRKDKHSKVLLVGRMSARRRNLKRLKEIDIDKFNWLIDELKIKLVPDYDLPVFISKRERRMKVAEDAAAALRNRKMEQFRKKLEAELIEFEKYKEMELADIDRSLKELGIMKAATLEETLEVLGMSEMMPKKKEFKTRDQQLLERMHIVFGEHKKILDKEILEKNNFIPASEVDIDSL